jgi:hypothetical protein
VQQNNSGGFNIMGFTSNVRNGIANTASGIATRTGNAFKPDSNRRNNNINTNTNNITQLSTNDSGGDGNRVINRITDSFGDIKDGIADLKERGNDWLRDNTILGDLAVFSDEKIVERLENTHDALTEMGWDKETGENENGDRTVSYTKQEGDREYIYIIDPGEERNFGYQIRENGEEVYDSYKDEYTEEEIREYEREIHSVKKEDLKEAEAIFPHNVG